MSVPLRGPPGFAATAKVTVPFPYDEQRQGKRDFCDDEAAPQAPACDPG